MELKKTIMVMVLGACTIAAGAGDFDSPYEKSFWAQSGNASWLSFRGIDNYGTVAWDKSIRSGEYALAQDGTFYNSDDFGAKGSAKVGDIALWGSFIFGNASREGALYNAMLFEPRIDMPFYAADLNPSNWKYQTYDMSAKLAFPLGNKFSAGLSADYRVGYGAKQVDPRTSTYVRDLSIAPSVAFRLSKHDVLGVNLTYINNLERSTPTLENTMLSQIVAIMRGLGFCTTGTVGGASLRTFIYTTQGYGAGVQYNHFSDAIDLFGEFSWTHEATDVNQNPNKPEIMGSTNKNLFVLDLGMESGLHRVDGRFSYGMTDGIEYVKTYDTSSGIQNYVINAVNTMSSYNIMDAELSYTFSPCSWEFGASTNFYSESDSYFPQTVFKASKIHAGVNALKKFNIKSLKLKVGLEGGYKAGLFGEYNFVGVITSPSLQVIKDDFYPSMINYHMANCADAGMRLETDIPLKDKVLAIGAAAKVVKPISMDSHCFSANFKIEYRF